MTHDGMLLFAALGAMAAFIGREWRNYRHELQTSARLRREEARRQRIEQYRQWGEKQ